MSRRGVRCCPKASSRSPVSAGRNGSSSLCWAQILLALPLLGDAYLVKVAIEVLCFALAAFSLNFLIGVGGIVSFGHAAYFGLGAYGAGLLAVKLGTSMVPALIAAPVIAGLGAALFGFFVVRLSGIYLAMLTLAFAQIVYAVAFQWVELTGGDNGVVGVWPSRWAASREVYYYLTLLVSVAAILLLRRAIYAPFGYTLRAARDSAVRADAIGIDVRAHRWLAFTVAGAAAGMAGGLFAFSKGSIDPTLIAIPDVDRFPGDDPRRRPADGCRPAGGRGLLPFAPGFLSAADRLLALLRGAGDHRHRAGIPARHCRWRGGPAQSAGAARPNRHRAPGGRRMSGGSLLSVERLAKSFGGVVAASEVSFTVEAGRLVAIIGPNGAGKSTIFNMVGGQLAPDSGRVLLAGRDITGLPPRRIWRLGLARTFQVAQTFLSLTVAENVQMAFVSVHRRTRAWWHPMQDLYRDEALDLLARVGMGENADRPCSELAYGDVKRVELAIALASAPKLLLMDEPTAGMAPKERAQLMELAAGIARERKIGVLFTEHDMDAVFGHADHVLVLVRGEIIAAGTAEEVRADERVREVYLGGGVHALRRAAG